MQKIPDISWKRVLAEGTAIVVSILLAFGIEAWWQDKQDRNDMRLVLSPLIEELTSLKQSDEQNQIYFSAIRESARELLHAAENEVDSLSIDEIDALLADLLWIINSTENLYPELNSLIVNGNISLISNPVLRQQLGSLKSELSAYNDIFQFNEEFYFDQQMPFFNEHSNLLQIGAADDGQPGITMRPAEYESIQSATLNDHSVLLKSTEFKNLLMRKVWLLDDLFVFRPKNLEQRIDAVIELLEEQVSE